MQGKAEQIWNKLRQHAEIPSMEQTNAAPEGRLFAAKRRRTLILYAAMCLCGVVPAVLSVCGAAVPRTLVACLLGLMVPGGGWLAAGHVTGIVLGSVTALAFVTAGFKLLDMFGNIVFLIILWLAGIAGGLTADAAVSEWVYLLPVVAALLTWGPFAYQTHQLYENQRQDHAARTKSFSEAKQLFDDVDRACGEEQGARELDAEGISAMRYLVEMTQREKGDFTGYDKFIPSSTSSYRYQFAMLGYALAVLQCHYTPNFHGYISAGQRFLIESYTDPRVCGYWKWECLGGYLRWEPDPVKKANIMLSGWAMAAMMLYESNTGDRRYEEKGALHFKPFQNSDKTYDYSFGELVRVFEKQWGQVKGVLFPCEPNLVFPVCNSYAMIAGLIYDRLYGTDEALKHYDDFVHALETEYCDMDGLLAIRKNLLTGLRFTPPTSVKGTAINNIAIAQEYLPIDPGLAKRCYAFVRHELMEIHDDGAAYVKGMPWDQAIDFGTMKRNPGLFLSNILMSATEFGDEELVEALFETERKILRRHKNRDVLRFKDVSVCGMANLALSAFCKKHDWSRAILVGPAQTAFTGPVLESCPYPQGIVAAAHSNGEDLSLVIHGHETVRLELTRLQPNTQYAVEGTAIKLRADAVGNAAFAMPLNGRTEIHVIAEGIV